MAVAACGRAIRGHPLRSYTHRYALRALRELARLLSDSEGCCLIFLFKIRQQQAATRISSS